MPQCLRFSRAAADDPVRAAVKNVANAGDSDCVCLRRERPLFDRVVDLAEDDVVDLVECEAGGLDRRVGHAQLLELDLELVKVPLAFLPEAVDGKEAQLYLKRYAKRYVASEPYHLLSALTLAAQKKLIAARALLERRRLTDWRMAMGSFPGGWERRHWLKALSG